MFIITHTISHAIVLLDANPMQYVHNHKSLV